jgi:hypothetical protein
MLVHIIDGGNRHHYRNAIQSSRYLRRNALFQALLDEATKGFCDGLELPQRHPEIEARSVELAVLNDELFYVASLRLSPVWTEDAGGNEGRQGPFGGVATLLGQDAGLHLEPSDWEVSAISYADDTSPQIQNAAGNLLAMEALELSARLKMGRFVGVCDPSCLFRLKRLGWDLRPLSLKHYGEEEALFAFACACGEDVLRAARQATNFKETRSLRLPDLGGASNALQIEGVGPLVELLSDHFAKVGGHQSETIITLFNSLYDEDDERP